MGAYLLFGNSTNDDVCRAIDFFRAVLPRIARTISGTKLQQCKTFLLLLHLWKSQHNLKTWKLKCNTLQNWTTKQNQKTSFERFTNTRYMKICKIKFVNRSVIYCKWIYSYLYHWTSDLHWKREPECMPGFALQNNIVAVINRIEPQRCGL